MAELNSSPEHTRGIIKRKRMSIKVDLTAMVDLSFLLITFFILTTTLSKPYALQLVMPVGNDQGGDPASRTMTICLGKNNKAIYYLGLPEKPLIAAQLVSYGRNGLRNAILETSKKVFLATGKNMMVIIKPANTSIYANLVDALDEMSITKIQQFAIADIAQKDIGMLKQKGAY